MTRVPVPRAGLVVDEIGIGAGRYLGIGCSKRRAADGDAAAVRLPPLRRGHRGPSQSAAVSVSGRVWPLPPAGKGVTSRSARRAQDDVVPNQVVTRD